MGEPSLRRFLRTYREVHAQERVEQERRRAVPMSWASVGFWCSLGLACAMNTLDATVGLDGAAWDRFRLAVGLVWLAFAARVLRERLVRRRQRRRPAPLRR